MKKMIKSGSFIKTVISDIIKSSEDRREYLGLELKNGLKALLISDPKIDMSAACMDVNIGHYSDPDDLPGLAHFCEHMLFMGTKKYPDENDYSKFLSEYGGDSNAYTDSENTNYHFTVSPDKLKEALDRFAQFFICPLFSEAATSREVRAVNSENDKNLKNDSWRMNQLEMSTCSQSHPYSKFGTGNLETLEKVPKMRKQSVREALLQFHNKFYSSNIMAFTVIGKESIEELKHLVEYLFSEIQNKNVEKPKWSENPLGPDQLKKLIKMVPTKMSKTMKIVWPIPDIKPYYKSKPEHYISHLIGHEGEGSLLSELKRKGWANSIEAGEGEGGNGFSFYTIKLDLTSTGIDNLNNIILTIFQYINMLKQHGPLEWIFKECQDLGAMGFKFKDEEDVIDYVSSCSANMQLFPIAEVLTGEYLLEEYRPDLITLLLNQLTPQFIRVVVADKKFLDICTQKEKWYGTKYLIEDINDSQIQEWLDAGFNESLKLPTKNDFIATNFSLLPRDEAFKMPILLHNTSFCQLWYLQDKEFNLPKACINIKFTCSFMRIDPVRVNYTSIFLLLLEDNLKEFSYNAQLAEIKYYVSFQIDSVILYFVGFNDKMCNLIEQVVGKLSNIDLNQERFDIYLDLYIRKLKNFQTLQPLKQASIYLKLLLSNHIFSSQDLLEAIKEVNYDGMKIFKVNIFQSIFIESLAYGNISKEMALNVVNNIIMMMFQNCCSKPFLPSQHLHMRQVKIPKESNFIFERMNNVHNNNALEVYYQCGLESTHNNMLLELFCQIIDEPCFNILRTQEQLGYLVSSSNYRLNGVQGLIISIQSDQHPIFIQKRINAFLFNMKNLIYNLTEDQFEKHKTALKLKRLEKPKNMQSQQEKLWTEINSKFYKFDRDQVETNYLSFITKEDIIHFSENFETKFSRKLSVHIIANDLTKNRLTNDHNLDTSRSEFNLIENEWSFKSSMKLYDIASIEHVPCVPYIYSYPL